MIWQQSWTAKSDYSRKYSDVILQTLIRDPPKGCKRLQITKAKAKSRFLAFPTVPLLFYPCPHFPPLSHKHKQQQICCLVLLKKWERHWNFDIFDWKLVLSSISQGQSYNQKVALFRSPSDLTNFVKICAFVQSLEVILERSDSLGWELPVCIHNELILSLETI